MNTQLKEWFRSKRNRPFTFVVNAVGLTLAFTAVVLMFSHLYAEWNHDAQVKYKKDIVRVETVWGLTAGAYGPWLKEVLPEVVLYCRLYRNGNMSVHVPGQPEVEEVFTQEEVLMADSTYPFLFSLERIRGGAEWQPQGIWLSESAARRLFGNADPIGKTLVLKNRLPLTVTALFGDVNGPGLQCPQLVTAVENADRIGGGNMTGNWDFANFETFLLLRSGTDRLQVEEKFKQLYGRHLQEKGTNEEWRKEAIKQAQIRGYEELYFDPQSNGFGRHGNRNNLHILSVITILVLVVSIINYVNMATARVADKIRMIGVKRILGARRASLVSSVMLDALLTCFSAMGAACLLASLLSPYSVQWTGFGNIAQMGSFSGWALLAVIPLVCGCLSGIFPAFYLIRMNRLESLNTRRNESRILQRFKGGLMVLQFAVSTGLIVSTLFIYKQVDYLKNVDPGYDRSNLLVVYGNGERILYEKYPEFRQALLQSPAIEKVGASKDPIYNVRERGFHLDVSGWDDRESVYVTWVDEHFMDLMGLQVVEGEGFREEDAVVKGTEKGINRKFIVNQQMAKEIAALSPVQDYLGGNRIGVVKDFNFRSMHEPVTPMYLGLLGDFNSVADVYVRVASGHQDEAMRYVEDCYRRFYPNTLYRYSFMDDDYTLLYGSEDLFARRLLLFAVLSVAIACLGLLGFVVFYIEQKTKSIGLRKVMGATEMEIMGLLNRSFVWRMLAGFGIACPVVYYLLTEWLSGFAYRTGLNAGIFAAAFLLMLFLALCSVSVLTWRAATANPVEALKAE